ncbi:MAG: CCA tRNA nucleotidyltransferase [Alphaproteobacteria bacterium]|nr:CCA tRNA nucleotidyltransferase [Alphaproteobacteria bacterium]MBT5540531.1 CCA tRNA nucleotidyltransferase [Alphaproteobacteria bacterium]
MKQIIDVLIDKSGPARFVGGCVRDTLLGISVTDTDIATPLDPEMVMERLKGTDFRVVPTGLKHGTVSVYFHGECCEITTLRRDVETFGRHARVEFTDDWLQDAKRRDFTINALYADFDGNIFDPIGGLQDLKAGRIRFVGDPEKRLEEDILRLLRLFRFQAYYGKSPLNPETLRICEKYTAKLEMLSGERIAKEIFRTLKAPNPAPIFQLMLTHKILDHIFNLRPDTTLLESLCKIERKLVPSQEDALRRFASIIMDRNSAKAASDRLKLSNRDKRRLFAMSSPYHDYPENFDPKQERYFMYQVSAQYYQDLMILHAATDVLERKKSLKDAIALCQKRLDASQKWETELVFPLKGQDLLDAGMKPGPKIKRVLNLLEEYWQEHDFKPSKQECLEHFKKMSVES